MKAKRQQIVNNKIIEQTKQQTADKMKGINYASGIGLEEEGVADQTPTVVAPPQCKFCGLYGHVRRVSGQCLKNKKYLESLEATQKERAPHDGVE